MVASAFTFLFDTVRKLNTNRYASDQTLPNHAAQLYTTHTLLPLLFTRVLETAPFPRMFKAKWQAADLVSWSVPWKKSMDPRYRTASPICSMTGEQARQLQPVLYSFERSLRELDCWIGTHVSVHLLANGLSGLSGLTEWPIRELDKAILSTRNRSHPWELAVAANDLFHVNDGFAGLSSINTQGLNEIIWYTKYLDRQLNDSLPQLEVSIRRILTAYESYLNATTALDNLGLSRCRTKFEREFANMDQLQDDMMDNGKEEEGKGDLLWRWSARLQGTIMGDTLPLRRRIPNISVANALSDGLYAYWALYCLIYTLRWNNNLLHESANSFIPPREFRFLKERPPPLQFPKEQKDTMASLSQAVRRSAIWLDFPNHRYWNWTHPITANITLKPFPNRIQCPHWLKIPAGSPSASMCHSTWVTSPASYPYAPLNSTTHTKLLGLLHLRNVFAFIRDSQLPYQLAVTQYRAWIDNTPRSRSKPSPPTGFSESSSHRPPSANRHPSNVLEDKAP
ncbi:MAG: hypothetical protein Q9185_004219 [Variospora sp. 1 TL-2023]